MRISNFIIILFFFSSWTHQTAPIDPRAERDGNQKWEKDMMVLAITL